MQAEMDDLKIAKVKELIEFIDGLQYQARIGLKSAYWLDEDEDLAREILAKWMLIADTLRDLLETYEDQ